MSYFARLKKLNHWLRNYFGFSKTESNGFIILIPLTLLVMIAPSVWRHHFSTDNVIIYNEEKLDSLVTVLESGIRKEKKKVKKEKKQRNNIYPTNRWISKTKVKEERKVPKVTVIKPFDINQADTTTLMRVYGIGPVLSKRIVGFRKILGGYTHKNQLKEVYGLKEEALEGLDSLSFIDEAFVPGQLNINELESYILDDHPYISKKLAKSIDSYVYQHGKIDSLEVLYKLHLFDSATVQKIYPYLKF